MRRFVAYRGHTEDVHIIRDGQKLPCSEVYIPTTEDLGMKDSAINDIQKRPEERGMRTCAMWKYTFSEDGSVAYGHLPDGIVFKEVAQ